MLDANYKLNTHTQIRMCTSILPTKTQVSYNFKGSFRSSDNTLQVLIYLILFLRAGLQNPCLFNYFSFNNLSF